MAPPKVSDRSVDSRESLASIGLIHRVEVAVLQVFERGPVEGVRASANRGDELSTVPPPNSAEN